MSSTNDDVTRRLDTLIRLVATAICGERPEREDQYPNGCGSDAQGDCRDRRHHAEHRKRGPVGDRKTAKPKLKKGTAGSPPQGSSQNR